MGQTDSIVLVQLSDLHFGAETIPRRWQPISGYRPHDFGLTQALPEALESVITDLRLSDEDRLHFVVSGDLTVSGAVREFTLASNYLTRTSRLDPRDVAEWGIGNLAGSHRKVPGNHDHWKGRRLTALPPWIVQQGFNPRLFPRRFEPHAWGPVAFECDSLRLQLSGADSQSGFRALKGNLRARGKIARGHLPPLGRRLEEALADDRAKPTVRALVVHHPIDAGRLPYMDLDRASCRRVVAHAARNQVRVVLVGHRHLFDARPPRIAVGGLRRDFWELRAPSAFQGVPRDGVHGFLVHELKPSGKARTPIRWTCYPYLWKSDDMHFRYEPADRVRFDLPSVSI